MNDDGALRKSRRLSQQADAAMPDGRGAEVIPIFHYLLP